MHKYIQAKLIIILKQILKVLNQNFGKIFFFNSSIKIYKKKIKD